jgi:D-alanyl-lipoteichoic acid acyltransferase DltB (MBOAT superfamily)
LGSLFFFKYCGWFVESLDALLRLAGQNPTGWVVSIALPVGISFFTFQLVSYLADVYRQKSEATTHLECFALYVAFFPKLVAGPIERQDRLQPQFEEARPPMNEETFREGLFHVLTGLFKKVVIADNLAVNIIETRIIERQKGQRSTCGEQAAMTKGGGAFCATRSWLRSFSWKVMTWGVSAAGPAQ